MSKEVGTGGRSDIFLDSVLVRCKKSQLQDWYLFAIILKKPSGSNSDLQDQK